MRRCRFVILHAILFSIILAVSLPSARSEEERWKSIGKSKTGTRWFIDTDTLARPSENLVSVWVRSVPDPEKSPPVEPEDMENTEDTLKRIQERYFGEYGYTEALWELDCSSAMFRLLYFCAYSGDNETLSSTLTPDAEWSFIMPGSVGEILRESVCGLRH